MGLRHLILRLGCGLIMVGFLVMAIRSIGWSLALQATLRVGPAALVLALAMTVLSMLISGAIWTRVLACLGLRAPVHVGITLYAGTGLASYIGSGAGAAGECILLLRRHGVCAGRAVLLLALASLVGFLGSVVWAPFGLMLLGAPAAVHALPALGTHGPLIVMIATVGCGLGGLIVLTFITVSSRLSTRWRVARLIADPSRPPLRLSLRHMLALIPVAAIGWMVGTLPLWVLVQAAAPSAAMSLPVAIGVQSVAAVIGSVAFFLPNGLGARDGAMVSLLVAIVGVPLPAAAAAVVLVRLSDPLAKALILLVLAGLRRVPSPSPSLSAPAPWRAASLYASISRSALAPWTRFGRPAISATDLTP